MAPGDLETDVVVVGSGIAGLVATLRALERGADVTLLEKGHVLGGTTRVTGGYIAYDEEAEPNIEPFEPLDAGLEWLRGHGVEVEDLEHWEHGESVSSRTRIEPPQFVDRMEDRIRAEGGDIRLRTPFEQLRTNDRGEVTGVIAYDYDEGRFEIAAPCVILAAGGRSGNEQLVREHFPDADLLLGRDPWSTGDGYLAAKEVGGKATGNLGDPIGVTRPAPPAEIAFEDMRCGQIYDTSSIAIDTDGVRFTDESNSEAQSDAFVQNYLDGVDGEAFLIFDRDIYENAERYQSAVKDRVELARELGGIVLEAETIEGLCDKLAEHGVDREQALATVRAFNAAVSGEADVELDPPRVDYREPMDSPPYYATKVVPAILYFVGGLDVDEHARVISRARSTSTLRYTPEHADEWHREPIEGLYAAGVEVGKDTEDGYYGGGLSLGLATGRIAGAHAAEYAKDVPLGEP